MLGVPDLMRSQVVGALLVPCDGSTMARETVLASAKPLISACKVPCQLATVARAPMTATNTHDRHAALRMLDELG